MRRESARQITRSRVETGGRRTPFLPYTLRSFAWSVRNFWPARRIPFACAWSGDENAATAAFCSSGLSCSAIRPASVGDAKRAVTACVTRHASG
jgi:hypothetical protein